jgi:beta-glucosidase
VSGTDTSGTDTSVDVDVLVGAMTLTEKCSLTVGSDNWHTAAVPRLGIPAVRMTDGPNGARGETSGGLSLTPSVCLPSATAIGASWDPELASQLAGAIARQALEKSAGVLLAPTVNLHRHPLWGRNFEAFSEDPLLTGQLAASFIRGVQDQGVIATVKHFIGNEAEFERNTATSEIDERTLRELYMVPFEYAVRRAGVLSIMTSYNRVNGEFANDSGRLLDGVLRREWGFSGFVMTDWRAILTTEKAAVSGLDIEMPDPPRGFGPVLEAAVRAGRVPESAVDAQVTRLLRTFERAGILSGAPERYRTRAEETESPSDRAEDRALARRSAAEGIVVLTNNGVLPLAASAVKRLALIGPNASQLAIMGGGSARVKAHYHLALPEVFRDRLAGDAEIRVVSGTGPVPDDAAARDRLDATTQADEAVRAARWADAVIVVVGTDDLVESEGYDQDTMTLPYRQDDLVAAVLRANPDAIVVVNTGGVVDIPWSGEAGAVLQTWFGGQELANGLADVLLGDAEPGGRLPTSWPLRVEHTPAFGSFPGENSTVRYSEGLLVGYRWYDTRHLPVRFPFGHGLSYSTFLIGEPVLSAERVPFGGSLTVAVPVTNTGPRPGSEVVQLYVAPPGAGIMHAEWRFRPAKELKAFAKVRLAPGETTTVTLELGPRAFAHYDSADPSWPELSARKPGYVFQHRPPRPALHRTVAGWYIAEGTYEIRVGRSSADIAHVVTVDVAGSEEPLDPGILPD